MIVDKKSRKMICTAFANGKRYVFRLCKESKGKIHPKTKAITNTGYQGLDRIHVNTKMPKKKTKKNPLSKEDQRNHKHQFSERVLNENVIGMLKRFKILAER